MAYYPRTSPVTFRLPGLLTVAYVIAGVVVAATHDYFLNVNTVQDVISAILAVLLWPLLFFGIGLHVH